MPRGGTRYSKSAKSAGKKRSLEDDKEMVAADHHAFGGKSLPPDTDKAAEE